MQQRKKAVKRRLALLLCLCMAFPMMGNLAFAADPEGGLCEHHPKHTAECGYQEGDENAACSYVCEICDGTEGQSETEKQDGFDEDSLESKKKTAQTVAGPKETQGNSEDQSAGNDPDKKGKQSKLGTRAGDVLSYSITNENFSSIISVLEGNLISQGDVELILQENIDEAFSGVEGRKITVKSAEGGTYRIDLGDNLQGDVVLDNVKVSAKGQNFFANGHKFETTSNFTGEFSKPVYGGSGTETVASTELILNGGTFTSVYGGGLDQNVTGDVHVTVAGATVSSLYGGGHAVNTTEGKVGGNVYLDLKSGIASRFLGGGKNEYSPETDRTPASVTGTVFLTAGYEGAPADSMSLAVSESGGAGSENSTVGNVEMKLLEGSSCGSLDVSGAGYNDDITGTVEILVDGGNINTIIGSGLEGREPALIVDGYRNRILNKDKKENAVHIVVRNTEMDYLEALGQGYGSQESDYIGGNVAVEVENSTIRQITVGGMPTNYQAGYGELKGKSTIHITDSEVGKIYGHRDNYEDDTDNYPVEVIFEGGTNRAGLTYYFDQVTVQNGAVVTIDPSSLDGNLMPFYDTDNLTVRSGGKLTTNAKKVTYSSELLESAVVDNGEWICRNYMRVGENGGNLTIQNGGEVTAESRVYIYGKFTATNLSTFHSSDQVIIGDKDAYTSASLDNSTWNDKKSAYVYGTMTLKNHAALNQTGSFRTYSDMEVTGESTWTNDKTSSTVDGDLSVSDSEIIGNGDKATEEESQNKQFNFKGSMDIAGSEVTSDLKFFVGDKVTSSDTTFVFNRSFKFGQNVTDPNAAPGKDMWVSTNDTVTTTSEKQQNMENEVFYYVRGNAVFTNTKLVLMDELSIWGNYTNTGGTTIRLPAFAEEDNYPEKFIPLEIGAEAKGETPVTLVKNSGDYTEEGQPIIGHNYINAQTTSKDVFKLANENAKPGGFYFKKLEDADKGNHGYDMWQVSQRGITLTPQDMTSYTGGDSLSGDAFPTARYQIEAADEVDLSKVTFTVDGEEQTVPSGTQSGDVITLPLLDDTFTLKDGASARAGAADDAVAGEYEIGVDTKDVQVEYADGNPIELQVEPGTLTVRNVSAPEDVLSGDVDIAQPVVASQDNVDTTDGIGMAVIPTDADYYTNGKEELGLLGDNDSDEAQVALLFDELLPGEEGQDTWRLLRDRAQEEGYDLTKERSEIKYLDLINENDGNAWVSTEDGTKITIYWPCPDGVTEENFSGQVLHFKGLHREYRDDLEEQVADAQVEVIDARIEDGNVVFELEGNQTSGSFSPFAIAWEETGASKPGDSQKPSDGEETGNTGDNKNTGNTRDMEAQEKTGSVKTGDSNPVNLWLTLLAVSGLGIAGTVIGTRKRERRRRRDR